MGLSRTCTVLHRWRWVLGYTALLLLSLNRTRRFLDWLEARNLSGLQGAFLLFACLGALLFLLRRIRRTQGGFTLSTLFRLLGFLTLYLSFLFGSTNLTVDRIHFVEYGILGLLCYQAVGPRYGPARRVAYAVVAVFAVGFLDEFIQGLLAIRYYARRDLAIDLLGGFLPMLAILWLRLYPGDSQEGGEGVGSWGETKKGQTPGPFRAADTVAVLLTLFLVSGVLWVGRIPGDLELLYGGWERENLCGRIERIRIARDGAILWEDVSGGRAQGRYRIGGNRLDGPLLEVEVEQGGGTGPCAWKASTRRDRYFEACPESLVFKKEREYPFRKINLPAPSRP